MPKKNSCFEIRMLSNMMKRRVDTEIQAALPDNLTATQSRLIAYLYRNRDRDIFQRDIENEFSVRRSTASVTLSLMEKNGFIVRRSVGHDARLKKLELTDKAIETHLCIVSIIERAEEQMLRGISEEELEEFIRIAEKIKSNL